MTTLARVIVGWEGTQVTGDGVSVLHFSASDSVPDPAEIADAYTALAAIIPAGVTMSVPGSGDLFDDTTGTLTGVWTAPGAEVVPGTAPSSCARGVGACVGWQTGGIINGRRLRGRTFLVPLTVNAYDLDGTITPSSLAVCNSFADLLMASGPLAVWHRPTEAAPASGNSYGVTSRRVRDKVAFLGSRRD